MGKATEPRLNRRSKGGRPRLKGDRTKGGRLKHSPNERVMEIRAAFGVDHIGQAFSPIQIALRNGWLSVEDCCTASEFASLYAAAGLGRSSISMTSDLEVKTRTETTGDPTAPSFFAQLPDQEVAMIWDLVFSNDGGAQDTREERAARAMRKWKAANAAMSPEQRTEVHNVCILDSFPQWVIHRASGHMGTGWERKRDLLISGLRAVRAALHPKTKRADEDLTFIPAEQPRQHVGAGSSTKRTTYVDPDGEPVLEVERVSRSTPPPR
ncbi:hypothetical protein O3U67_15770 [Brevundimonas diminuta]|uniref:hypothetical protein n=1 Tax=Brevundimonas diminuta TaxID=293 RepID=UPI0022AFD596|nr:hypothetical protein [Brevundimonas diminuta]MCZ4109548.1 hypothetical protein [Brevundimonas diminuta]